MPPQSVGRENLEDFIAYGFYNAPWESLGGDTQRQIREFLARVEAAWGVQFREGRNPHAAFMRHLWEPLRSVAAVRCPAPCPPGTCRPVSFAAPALIVV